MKNLNNETIYLLEMGCRHSDGRNHRIRLCVDDVVYNNETIKLTIDFSICTPWAIHYTKKGNRKTKYGVEDSGLGTEIYLENGNGCWGVLLENLNIKDLEYFEAPFNRFLKYTEKNILTIINYFLKSQYKKIQLLEARYILNFNYDTFNSVTYKHDEKSYTRALDFKKIAQQKIKELKYLSQFDNSSYSYEGKVFEIIVRYNCYNDYLYFNLIDDIEYFNSIEAITNYKIPVEEIKKGIANHCIKTSVLY